MKRGRGFLSGGNEAMVLADKGVGVSSHHGGHQGEKSKKLSHHLDLIAVRIVKDSLYGSFCYLQFCMIYYY